jgi:hypothetical protein
MRSKEFLMGLFAQFGDIKSVKFSDRTCVAFVDFVNPEYVEKFFRDLIV